MSKIASGNVVSYYFAFQSRTYLLAIAFALHLSSGFHGVPIFPMIVVVILILSPFCPFVYLFF